MHKLTKLGGFVVLSGRTGKWKEAEVTEELGMEEELRARFWKEAAMVVAGALPFSIEEIKMYQMREKGREWSVKVEFSDLYDFIADVELLRAVL